MPQGEVKESPVAGIDTLPDEALQHVLGFLPAREAVRTCVLARRWRHLWRSVSAVRVTSTDFSAEQEFSALNKFVNNLLHLRDPKAPLDFCEFLVTLLGHFYEELPRIRSWIAQALLYHARILRVHYNDMDAGLPMNLGDLHFISQHLTTMELKSVQVTGDFSSCLVLKNLRMMRCDVISDKLSCQSVRQLTLIECMFLSGTGNRARISAPSVVWLELSDGLYKTPLFENMPSLVNAFIRLSFPFDCCGKVESGNSSYNNSCATCAGNILKGLSNAESLELVIAKPTMFDEFIFKWDLMWHPTFSKLKTLLLNEWCVSLDFCALICFLRHTPVLEKLTLQLRQAPDNWVKPREKYVPSKELFASKKLRVIEIKCEKFDVRVHQISRMLSIYNSYLEKVTIECSERSSECYSFQKNEDLA